MGGDKTIPLRRLMEDLLCGLSESHIPIIYTIIGKSDRIDLYIGTYQYESGSNAANLETIKALLIGSFPGLIIQDVDQESVEKSIGSFNYSSLVTGSPDQKTTDQNIEMEQIDRLIRGLFGKEWMYFVVGHPMKNSETNTLYNSVLNEMRVVADFQEKDGIERPIAKQYQGILDVFVAKLDFAKSIGLWYTNIYLFAQDVTVHNRIKAVAKSVFGGRESLPDRIRVLNINKKITFPALILTPSPPSPGQFTYPYSYLNITNSWDLSCFIQLPMQEMPGFEIKPYTRFCVSKALPKKAVLTIGDILDQGEPLGTRYSVPLEDLNKHGLIVGTTGSGKTNTLFHIIRELWGHDIPFLVIEPVKTEYRKLLSSTDLEKNLQVFTLGDNTISPFRINPFEVLPGVSVQTHIELLKSVFNASFFMWGSLPQVLERCIHEVYLDKGWDLTTGQNSRGLNPDAQPTLTDLYNKVDEVTDRLGYSAETTMEIKGALKTRIDSMRIGGKGLMLDTRRTFSFDVLMQKPTILELEAIGDDEEKCFIMGLILTRMYEYYVSKGLVERKDLSHITVIEEAHRLLGMYQADNQYVANVKGKAVETFSNILAEIRAYGEGFLIAEQIPTKLTPEVVKNTNLKILHRLVAEDDRKVMCATMNISERESGKITALSSGEAAVYSEGDWGAYHVKVPYSKLEGKSSGQNKDNDLVKNAMVSFLKEHHNLPPYEGCVSYCRAICAYKHEGATILEQRRFYSQMPYITLHLFENPGYLPALLLQIFEAGQETVKGSTDNQAVQRCAIIQEAEIYLNWLGSRYQWSFENTESLKRAFTSFLVDALDKYLEHGTHLSIEHLDKGALTTFQTLYTNLCKGSQPTPFCQEICPGKMCLYRYYISEVLADSYYDEGFRRALGGVDNPNWKALGESCYDAVQKIIMPEGASSVIQKIGLCYGLQKIYGLNMPRNITRTIMENLIHAIRDEMKPDNPKGENTREILRDSEDVK